MCEITQQIFNLLPFPLPPADGPQVLPFTHPTPPSSLKLLLRQFSFPPQFRTDLPVLLVLRAKTSVILNTFLSLISLPIS